MQPVGRVPPVLGAQLRSAPLGGHSFALAEGDKLLYPFTHGNAFHRNNRFQEAVNCLRQAVAVQLAGGLGEFSETSRFRSRIPPHFVRELLQCWPMPRFPGENWLPDMDLNHDKQIQSLLCYRYTIGQTSVPNLEGPRAESSL